MGINVTGDNVDPLLQTMTTVEYERSGTRGYIAGWGQQGINRALIELQVRLREFREEPPAKRYLIQDVRVAWRNDRHPWNNR